MAISTNSIIHYTKNLESLKGILAGCFKVKYCTEIITDYGAAFPMVCFCDIPLSEVKNHLEAYGYYGIGLTKSWAKMKGLNPVLYLTDDSSAYWALLRQSGRIWDKSIDTYFRKNFITFASFSKRYDGELIRGNQIIDKYRFYDEREWRYVPNAEDLKGAPASLSWESYVENKKQYNDELKDVRLTFSHSDISYIIIKSENEITEMTRHLREVFSEKCNAEELEILLTKILTCFQIANDF